MSEGVRVIVQIGVNDLPSWKEIKATRARLFADAAALPKYQRRREERRIRKMWPRVLRGLR